MITTEGRFVKEDPAPENPYLSTAAEVADLVAEKNAAYGDSFRKAGEILRVLYPAGVAPDQYENLLAVTRIIDKLFRIATARDALGEDPWQDICGYGLLATVRRKGE